MQTFRIQCEHPYTAHVVNITAPSELDALNRAFDLAGVVRAYSLGATRGPAAILVSQIEATQEQPLASVLAALAQARTLRTFGATPQTRLGRRQAD